MEITIKGSPKEIAALAVEVQERQGAVLERQIEKTEHRDAVKRAQEAHDLLRAVRRADRMIAERAKRLGVPMPASEEPTDRA